MKLRDVPIKRKLTLVIMLTSTVVLLLTSGAFIVYELATYKNTQEQYSRAMAQIIAANSSSALNFDDPIFATELLTKLKVERTIVMACLYDTNGKLFAYYPTNQNVADFPSNPGKGMSSFGRDTLTLFTPVREDRKRIGTLLLKTDLTPMYERLRLYGGIVSIVTIGSFFIALGLSQWLQKRISAPILELAETARAVSVNKDYLVRARKHGTDELGLLTDAFNHMLTQIHERDVALRQNEERLRLSLQASRTGAWDWNLETGSFRWDDYVYRLFGVTPDLFDGYLESFLNYIHPDDRSGVSRQINRALAQKTDFFAEFRVTWPDKSVHYLASRGKAFYDDQGKPTRMSGVILDVTESIEAARASSLLAAIVESSDDSIVGKNLDGTIVSWNAGAEGMFGYTAAEAIGRKSSFIVPPEYYEDEVQSLAKIQAGRVEHYETLRVRKDGSLFHVSLTMSPIKNAEGKIIGASANSRDISDRIRAEKEIHTLNAELEDRVLRRTAELAATNKELEAFTYSVSHDLRAPLRHIDAFAQILQEELKLTQTSESRKYIERIRAGVQNMGRLVDDLLNLSRVGRREVDHKTVHLNAILEGVLSDLKSEVGTRAVEWHIAKLPDAKCDPGLIKQVFMNLLSNALKYSRPREKAVIEVGVREIDGGTAIFIRDNGVGFDMKYIGKLFGVFQRLHRAEDFEGTGVGLATVQRIVHLHRGRIWAEAELDKGANFYFTLQGMERS